MRRRDAILLSVSLCGLAGLAAFPIGGEPAHARLESAPGCSCELRSWVVAGRGRHMFVSIDCPHGFDALDTVVEFTSAAMRRDFVGPIDPERMPRIAKMNRGVRLRPALGAPPDDRLELTFTLAPREALELQRDRLFSEPYVLVGANSNAAMRAALAAVGVELPERIVSRGGMRGEFPGIDLSPGEILPVERWGEFNLPTGPEPAPTGFTLE